MKRFCNFVLALACIGIAHADNSWKTVASKQGKIAFSLPWQPEKKVQSDDLYQQEIFTLIRWTDRYLVVAAKFTDLAASGIKQSDNGPGMYSQRFILDQLVDGFVRGSKGKPLQNEYFKFQGHPARRMHLLNAAGVEMQVIGTITKSHLYLFSASYAKDDPEQANYKRFFSSIKLDK